MRIAYSNDPPHERSQHPEFRRICHYYTNYGYCPYEEQTKRTCRYEHRTAPMCNDGDACTRAKCMYTHPNLSDQAGESFLDRHQPSISQPRVPQPRQTSSNSQSQQSSWSRAPTYHQMLSKFQNLRSGVKWDWSGRN